MGQVRIDAAIERIEAALQRIDTACETMIAAHPSAQPEPSAQTDLQAEAMDQAKKVLQGELAGTLRDLDRLIESMER